MVSLHRQVGYTSGESRLCPLLPEYRTAWERLLIHWGPTADEGTRRLTTGRPMARKGAVG